MDTTLNLTPVALERVNVLGCSGSGKSTFSRRLAALLEVTYLEMDALFWQPHWTEPTDAVFVERLGRALEAERWILDGNYSRTATLKWQRVTAIIWLDYPLQLALRRVLWRSIVRSLTRAELWPGTGNRESLRRLFFSRTSIALWTLQNHGKARRRYMAAMSDPRWAHIPFIRLRSPAEAERLLRALTAARRDPANTRQADCFARPEERL
jgi:adenylate kinase family enzyme